MKKIILAFILLLFIILIIILVDKIINIQDSNRIRELNEKIQNAHLETEQDVRNYIEMIQERDKPITSLPLEKRVPGMRASTFSLFCNQDISIKKYTEGQWRIYCSQENVGSTIIISDTGKIINQEFIGSE